MYRFVRMKSTNCLGETHVSSWLFEPQSISDVFDFFEKYTMAVHNNGTRKMVQSIANNADKSYEGDTSICYDLHHPTSDWEKAHYLYMTHSREPQTPLTATSTMLVDLLNSRLETFKKKGEDRVFYDPNGLTTMVLDERFSVVFDTIEKDKLIFPDNNRPSIEDVSFTMWSGGKHWYAKVCGMDIVVNGEQKWNTKAEAIEAAKIFIEQEFD